MTALPAFELPEPDEEEEPSWMSHVYAGPPAPLPESVPEPREPRDGKEAMEMRLEQRELNEWRERERMGLDR